MAKSHITGTREEPCRAFMDRRVFLVSPDDSEAYPGFSADLKATYVSQVCDGPTFVTITPQSSDSGLASVAERYNLPIAELQRFRECLGDAA